MKHHTLRIGLTGGIGSGKTEACKIFSTVGIQIIDADEIAHTLVQTNQNILRAIIDEFGEHFLTIDGKLNRQKLRHKIFYNQDSRSRLEAILHPTIYSEIERRIAKINNPYCILCIPLLLETDSKQLVDRILVIDTPENIQLLRASNRDNTNKEEISKIMQAQISRHKRLALADDIIINDQDISYLNKQVLDMHKHYLNISSTKEKT